MIFSKLKTRLIMGASLILAACMVADKAAEQMKDKMNTKAYKVLILVTAQ